MRADRPAAASAASAGAAAAWTVAWLVAVELASTAAAARLPDREVGGLTLGSLAFLSRQRGAYQPAVHRAIVVGGAIPLVIVVEIGIDVRIDGGVRIDVIPFGGQRHFRRIGGFCLIVVVVEFFVSVFGNSRPRAQRALDFARLAPIRLAAARRGGLTLLVFVVGVAGCAAGLLHLVVDHRDHRMVGDAALTRTIVVQNVTEPRPALLH
jgi:hypothetical protein